MGSSPFRSLSMSCRSMYQDSTTLFLSSWMVNQNNQPVPLLLPYSLEYEGTPTFSLISHTV